MKLVSFVLDMVIDSQENVGTRIQQVMDEMCRSINPTYIRLDLHVTGWRKAKTSLHVTMLFDERRPYRILAAAKTFQGKEVQERIDWEQQAAQQVENFSSQTHAWHGFRRGYITLAYRYQDKRAETPKAAEENLFHYLSKLTLPLDFVQNLYKYEEFNPNEVAAVAAEQAA